MTAYPGCAGLARSPFVLTEHISSDKRLMEVKILITSDYHIIIIFSLYH